jgi:hypothetical protein
MKDKKFDFYFPTEVLKDEDFSPIDIFILKDYYRNAFLELIDKVRFNINNIFRLEKIHQKDYS